MQTAPTTTVAPALVVDVTGERWRLLGTTENARRAPEAKRYVMVSSEDEPVVYVGTLAEIAAAYGYARPVDA